MDLLQTKVQLVQQLSPLAPLFKNTTSLQAAMQHNTLGIGYAGAGFLLFYYIGVSKVLQQLGVIKPGVTKTAGASAGILSAAVDYGFVSHDDFIKYGKEFAARCRANHNCAGSLGQEVARMSQKLTPPDAAKKINGVGYIALSSPNFWGYPVGDYVVNYKTRQDVLDAVYAGVYVPLWSGPTITTSFHGQKKYDGAFRTPLPCPRGNTTYCITVSVLPLGWNVNEVMRQMADPKIWPILDDWVNTTFGDDPMKFVAQSILTQFKHPGQMWNEVAAGWFSFFWNQPKFGVDIYPGKYNKNPYPLLQWILMILAAPKPEDIDTFVAMGVNDAKSWAREQGLLPKNPYANSHPSPPGSPKPSPRPSPKPSPRPASNGGSSGSRPAATPARPGGSAPLRTTPVSRTLSLLG